MAEEVVVLANALPGRPREVQRDITHVAAEIIHPEHYTLGQILLSPWRWPQMQSFSYWIGIAGITAFAVTAVLVLAPKGIDLFSAIVLGIITAVGGGTIRDMTLDVPVFWAADLNYLWVAIGASLVTFFAESLFTRREIYQLMLYIDGLGAALFAIQTVDKAWAMDFGRPLAPIILGIVTAIGGGLLRDVLSGRQTLLMTRELYATPVLIGCTLYVNAINLSKILIIIT